MLALAGLLALPAAASAGMAGAAATPDDLEAKVDMLTRQLAELKAQMESMKEDQDEFVDEFEEKSEDWDLASRFKFYGDFRARGDYYSAEAPGHYGAMDVANGVGAVLDAGSTTNIDNLLGAFAMTTADPLSNFAGALSVTPQANFEAAAVGAGLSTTQAADLAAIFYDPSVGAMLGGMPAATTIGDVTGYFANTQQLVAFMKNLSPADRARIFNNLTRAYTPQPTADYDNNTMFTNRFRLNMRVNATENIEFKTRLAMYKAWGMQNNPVDYTLNGGTAYLSTFGMDGAATRQPDDSVLRVDRAFVNWNNIGGQPIWFSIGRRPTSDGPPAHIRLGTDERMATPISFMDYPFDGLSLGYAYSDLFGLGGTGRVRFCYGRGFESGPTDDGDGLKDTDFAGLSWDIYKDGPRFINFQSFASFDIFNVPDNVTFANPLELALGTGNGTLDRQTMGNIYHTSLLYMDKWKDLNFFGSFGWSRTDPRGVDEMGTGLLTSWWDDDYDESENGYSVYLGMRYDLEDLGLKLGLEYNYGSKNWLAFTPGHDDMYQAKLATRGDVYEAYLIWDLPAGEAVSKYAKTFVRLGYQHYDYDYTGSGFWLGKPIDIDDLSDDPLNAQFYTPTEEIDQIYLTFEAFF